MKESDGWMPAHLPPGQPALVRHEEEPENAEFSISYLNGWITPNSLYFRRNHFAYPKVDPATWELRVSGMVNRPLRLSLDHIQSMARTSQWTTLECSGNKRRFFAP